MTTIRMFTISVEYNEDYPDEIEAVDNLAAAFEDKIGRVGLSLDNLEEETIS